MTLLNISLHKMGNLLIEEVTLNASRSWVAVLDKSIKTEGSAQDIIDSCEVRL